jgi:hypothetical protein
MDEQQECPGRLEAIKGEQRVLFKAEKNHPNWGKEARGWLVKYARQYPELELNSEVVRDFAEAQGFQPAHDNRAWGPVMRLAAEGRTDNETGLFTLLPITYFTGNWYISTHKKSHCSPKRCYFGILKNIERNGE